VCFVVHFYTETKLLLVLRVVKLIENLTAIDSVVSELQYC